MARLKHPHEGRVAEVYRENEFAGYTPEPIGGPNGPLGALGSSRPTTTGDQSCGGL
jgi:hypothetical protein